MIFNKKQATCISRLPEPINIKITKNPKLDCPAYATNFLFGGKCHMLFFLFVLSFWFAKEKFVVGRKKVVQPII